MAKTRRKRGNWFRTLLLEPTVVKTTKPTRTKRATAAQPGDGGLFAPKVVKSTKSSFCRPCGHFARKATRCTRPCCVNLRYFPAPSRRRRRR